ncbi:undecaprenyl-phosphate galactose phosphotransferase WbaP [Candidatus Aminicenantes bacterium AH-873-B07]|nr:undecaprenyl-phosphate galactose phosphotransferase WbaP [Candidatus Aminicenantes bacterium AH-873-B07]
MAKKIVSLGALIFSDFIAIIFSFSLAYLIRREILPLIYYGFQQKPVPLGNHLEHFYMFIIWIIIFTYEKLYTKRYSFWDETRLLLKSTTISFSLIMIAVFITRQYAKFSRTIIILAWLLSFVFLPIFRFIIKTTLIKLNLWRKKVIIIGHSKTVSSIIKAIRDNRTLGYEVIGCLTSKNNSKVSSISGVKILGNINEIEKWKQKTGFEDIIISLPNLSSDKMIGLLKRCEQISDTIRYVPRTGELITAGVEIENIGKTLSLSVKKNLAKPWNILIKNIFELSLALILVILTIPLFIVISLAIKIDSKGPIFFMQERFGKRGKKIKLIKFRSMYEDADLRLKKYLNENPLARKEWRKFKKLKTFDPRVTRVGKFLRKHSLDELPQLLNVLKGEMSLVGPRPYLMEEIKEIGSVRSILLQVKPGITGLWQISGRSLLPFKERLNLDEYYIRNWSFWLDIIILIKTVKVLMSGEGAY